MGGFCGFDLLISLSPSQKMHLIIMCLMQIDVQYKCMNIQFQRSAWCITHFKSTIKSNAAFTKCQNLHIDWVTNKLKIDWWKYEQHSGSQHPWNVAKCSDCHSICITFSLALIRILTKFVLKSIANWLGLSLINLSHQFCLIVEECAQLQSVELQRIKYKNRPHNSKPHFVSFELFAFCVHIEFQRFNDSLFSHSIDIPFRFDSLFRLCRRWNGHFSVSLN